MWDLNVAITLYNGNLSGFWETWWLILSGFNGEETPEIGNCCGYSKYWACIYHPTDALTRILW